MKHFIVTYSANHRVTQNAEVPFGLSGDIRVIDQLQNKVLSVKDYWHATKQNFDFGSISKYQLQFVCNHRGLKLDFYPLYSGFLASERLLQYLYSIHVPIEFFVIDMLRPNGESSSLNKMYFCQFISRQSVCDFTAMDIDGKTQVLIDSPNSISLEQGHIVIARSVNLKIKTRVHSFVQTYDIPTLTIIVNESFSQIHHEHPFQGVELLDTNQACVVDFMPTTEGYYLTKPHYRRISDLEYWQAAYQIARTDFRDPAKPTDPVVIALLKTFQEQQKVKSKRSRGCTGSSC